MAVRVPSGPWGRSLWVFPSYNKAWMWGLPSLGEKLAWQIIVTGLFAEWLTKSYTKSLWRPWEDFGISAKSNENLEGFV